MSQSEEIEFAWACGFFEGEGSVIVTLPCIDKYGTKRAFRSAVVLSNTDLDVLERFHAIVGIGEIRKLTVYTDDRAVVGTKPVWRWASYRREPSRAFLLRAYPFLGKRRKEQADKLLALPVGIANHEKTHCPKGHEYGREYYGKRVCKECAAQHYRDNALEHSRRYFQKKYPDDWESRFNQHHGIKGPVLPSFGRES